MAERSKLTLETLRQLARKHLDAGYSRLTRSQLIEALRKVVPKLVQGEDETAEKPARGAGRRVAISDVEQEAEQLREASLRKKADAKKAEPGARPVTARRVDKKGSAKTTEKRLSRGLARVKSAIATIAKEVESRRKPAEKPAKKAEKRAEKKAEPVAAKAEPKAELPAPREPEKLPEAPAKPPEPPPAREAKPAAEEERERPKVIARSTIERAPEVMAAWLRTEREVRAQRAATEGPAGEAARPFPAEPVVEGFFVARVAGRGEARRHHLTDEYATGPKAEAQAPSPYDGRRIFLLPRDPSTLFVYWDALAAGIDLAPGERLVVRILRGEEPLRELAATELAHGYYVEGLTPGAAYRAQAFAVGPRGQRVVDASGLPVVLPHIGEPAERVRFLRVPGTAPLPHLREFLRSGHAQFAERAGTVLVTVPVRTWRESGGAWAFTLSGSGSGRWLREGGEVVAVEEVAIREWEEAGQPRVEGKAAPGELPGSLSGAGRESSPRSGWGRK